MEYEQLKTVDFYLFVQMYSLVFQEAYEQKQKSQSLGFIKIKLPKLREVLDAWEDQVYLNLEKH